MPQARPQPVSHLAYCWAARCKDGTGSKVHMPQENIDDSLTMLPLQDKKRLVYCFTFSVSLIPYLL